LQYFSGQQASALAERPAHERRGQTGEKLLLGLFLSLFMLLILAGHLLFDLLLPFRQVLLQLGLAHLGVLGHELRHELYRLLAGGGPVKSGYVV